MKEPFQRLHASTQGLFTNYRVGVDNIRLDYKAKLIHLALNGTCNLRVETAMILIVIALKVYHVLTLPRNTRNQCIMPL